MRTSCEHVLVTGVDTALGAAVRSAFTAKGAAVVGTAATVTDPATEIALDPRDPAAVTASVSRAAELLGGLDTLVVAHPLPLVAPISDQSMEDFWAHVDATLTGTFLIAQAAAALMRDNETRGRMVLTTSRWHVGGTDLSAVAAAAGGVVALTKSLTRDFGRFRIGVEAVAVGCVDSEWSICDARNGSVLPPLGRTGTVEQVARVIEVLSRPQLGAAVGQIVNVDGGLSRNRV